jgi:hypothetical protein
MSRFWGNIICLFCICFFSFAIANDVNLLSCFHFSDKKYAKNIEIYAYLITKDQVVKLFDEENGEVIQKTNKELYGQEVFLLVRCKNLGDSKSFGTLNCTIPSSGPISITIMMMPRYMKSFYDSVLYMGNGLVPNDKEIPIISYEWKSVYTM